MIVNLGADIKIRNKKNFCFGSKLNPDSTSWTRQHWTTAYFSEHCKAKQGSPAPFYPPFHPSFILLFLSPSLPSSLSLYIPSFFPFFFPVSLLSFHQAQENTFALRHEKTSLQFVLFDTFWNQKLSNKWNIKPCAPSRIQQALLWYQKRVMWKRFLSNWR